MDAPVFYRGGGFEVTDALLRTPRKTYKLGQIEYVSVQRPLLFFAGLPAIGLIGFCAVFWRYLHGGEIVALLAGCSLALAAALIFGTLRVHSLALRGDEITTSIGAVARLREVRMAVEWAMQARQDQDGETRP